MTIDVKICGLKDTAVAKAAVNAGARYVGFVFCSHSKRFVSPEAVGKLAALIPASVKRVGLFEDADDITLRETLRYARLDILQLHGNETPARVAEIHALTDLPVMKALRIATAKDVDSVVSYESVADMLLFDARIDGGPLGGTGKSFDWMLLHGRKFSKPWMLAGGLNASNLAEAVRITGAKIVDVSSGVEDADGNKNPYKIAEFIALAKNLG